MMHKVSGLVLNATDSILIARFFGLGTAGLYSNYLLILGIVTALMQQVSSAATAGVGHLTATESVGHAIRIFKFLEFYYLWVYTFATLSLLTMLNPFIRLWLGPSFVLDMGVVTVICLNFYLVGRRQVCNTFRNALGLYWHDRYRGPVEAAANLVLSLRAARRDRACRSLRGDRVEHGPARGVDRALCAVQALLPRAPDALPVGAAHRAGPRVLARGAAVVAAAAARG